MAENNNTKEIMEGIFRGMDGLISSKTVVGEPIPVGETTLIPLMEVSMGMGAGAFAQDKAAKGKGNAGAGALSTRITPTAMLLLQNGKCKLINIKNQDTMTKLLDMLPDLVERISGGSRVSKTSEEKAQELLSESEPEFTVEELSLG